MVSLKTENPFAKKSVELLSVKTWVGLGAFAIVAGVFGLMAKWVMDKGASVKNPALSVYEDVMGAIK